MMTNQEHMHEIPIFSRTGILEVAEDSYAEGTDKRTLKVFLSERGNEVSANLKLYRPILQDAESGVYRTPSEVLEQAEKEYELNKRIYDVWPELVPRPIGIYTHKNLHGFLSEHVTGINIVDNDLRILRVPDILHVRRLALLIHDLRRKGIHVDEDTVSPINLRIGVTQSNVTPRILLIDITEHRNMRTLERENKRVDRELIQLEDMALGKPVSPYKK